MLLKRRKKRINKIQEKRKARRYPHTAQQSTSRGTDVRRRDVSKRDGRNKGKSGKGKKHHRRKRRDEKALSANSQGERKTAGKRRKKGKETDRAAVAIAGSQPNIEREEGVGPERLRGGGKKDT